jgi:DNA-binding NarL/FixJ family response regulator
LHNDLQASGETPGFEAAAPRNGPALGILVVSEVRILQQGIVEALKYDPHLSLVGTATIADAAARARELKADAILFDATRRSRVALARQIASSLPGMKIVAFGVTENAEEILALAAAGIAGYVREDAAVEEVAAVIGSIMRDELVCSPRAAASLYHWVAVRATGEAGPAPDQALSRRELEIAGLIERGLSNKEIARRLGIEATTVKNHVHNILDKLQVHRRGEAAARIRRGLRARPQRETPDADPGSTG